MTAMSVMTLALYVVAMIFSLCGSKYFILNYQNEQMDRIENWFRSRNMYATITFLFITLESSIILSFVLMKFAKWWHILSFYLFNVVLSFILMNSFQMGYTVSQFILIIGFIFLDNFIENKKKIKWRGIGNLFKRLIIAIGVVFMLQIMIFVIKNGNWSFENHVLNLSAFFIYSIEYDIALSVILVTISLYIDKGKGDSKLWVTAQDHGSSSLTTKKNLKKLSLKRKNLTKTQKKQRNKILKFWIKLYLIQLLGFAIIMILPFLMGKVFEFLVMYLAFAVVRYILGFKYSLHFKNEITCLSVGAIVFGLFTLAVPFFYITLIIAISLGVGLAMLLYFSYKYRGYWIFAKMARPDKFALLYTYFDGNLNKNRIHNRCVVKDLDEFQTSLIEDFMEGNKMIYLCKKYGYSQRMMIYKLDEAIDKLIH